MLIDLQVSWEVVGDCGGFLLFGFALLFCHSFGRGNRKRKESGKKIEIQKSIKKLFWDIGCWDWPSRAFWSLGGVFFFFFFFFFITFFFWVFWRIYYYRLITTGLLLWGLSLHHHSHYGHFNHHGHYNHYSHYSRNRAYHYRIYHYQLITMGNITIPVCHYGITITMGFITIGVITIRPLITMVFCI